MAAETATNDQAILRAGRALLASDVEEAKKRQDAAASDPADEEETEKRSLPVNGAGVSNANSLISSGKIDQGAWGFSGSDGDALLGDPQNWDNFGKYHLAIDSDVNAETKARYKYPFGKGGKIYRSGVIAAKSRAAGQGDTAIAEAADRLLQKINKKLGIVQKNTDVLSCVKCGGIAPLHISGNLEAVKALDCSTCGAELKDAVVSKSLDKGFDFKPGDEGEGTLTIHERGLSESQVQKSQSFGWDVVQLTEKQLEALNELHEADWKTLVEKAVSGNSAPLAKEVEKASTSDDKDLLDLVSPVSVHSDLRLKRDGDDFWEGPELFTSTNQFQGNALQEIVEDASKMVLASFRVPEDVESDVIRGDLGWLEVGKRVAKSCSPGSPGSTDEAWSRFKIIDSFRWKAGVQDEDVKEFFFEGDVVKGRFVFESVTLPDGRSEWALSRPEDQEVEKSDTEDLSIVIPIAKAEKRLVTGVVLQPDIVDGQGDVATEEAIEKACHEFFEAWIAKEAQLGIQHSDYTRDLDLVENYVALDDMEINGEVVKAGSWIMTVRVNDDEIWEAVKSAELTAFSIKGKVRVIKPAA